MARQAEIRYLRTSLTRLREIMIAVEAKQTGYWKAANQNLIKTARAMTNGATWDLFKQQTYNGGGGWWCYVADADVCIITAAAVYTHTHTHTHTHTVFLTDYYIHFTWFETTLKTNIETRMKLKTFYTYEYVSPSVKQPDLPTHSFNLRPVNHLQSDFQ